ncbi:GEVED domain-containing protein [Planctomycetota bacterium]
MFFFFFFFFGGGGGGSGYEKGRWYYYPNTEWWNQWFDNRPFNPNAKKEITISFTVSPYQPVDPATGDNRTQPVDPATGAYTPPGAPASVEVAINWSTEQWEQEDRPPLPDDVGDDVDTENLMIGRYVVYRRELVDNTPRKSTWTLQLDYCPAWVSVDVRGFNVVIRGGEISHICRDKSENAQACCFPDGSCADLTPEECKEQGGVPQGTGSDCSTVNCSLPEFKQACCLADGTCIDATASQCRALGGTPQGLGTDCSSTYCDCQWYLDDPHKMHWPQLPKPGGYDVAFGSTVLADDWRCSGSGPVEDIHLWVSWRGDRRQLIEAMKVMIYSDKPDPDGDGPQTSRPDDLLWQAGFQAGDFTIHDMPEDEQHWFDPWSGESQLNDHVQWQQIDICTIHNPFIQEKGTIYWLAVAFPGLESIGWKQSGSQHFNDNAVFLYPNGGGWLELRAPIPGTAGMPLDLAFVITGEPDDTDVGLEFGDAPEGSLAYPEICVYGSFPTCVNTGPAGWIQHKQQSAWFGQSADQEADGNAGLCPLFNPDTYNQDECFGDGDAGLLIQPSHTIKGPVGSEFYFTCAGDIFGVHGMPCQKAVWGDRIDIEVHNHMPTQQHAYVNVLIDWNRDGSWGGSSSCPAGIAPEHVLVNFVIPNPYDGPLSALVPPDFLIGPTRGYVWARFSITEQPITTKDWDGSGAFDVGETEDYLLYILQLTPQPLGCYWQEGDPHKMHWPQLPDLTPVGMDINMYPNVLADDFLCTATGPIRDIHFWASYKNDCLPAGGFDSVGFEISIYDDIPAGASTAQSFSRPGDLLWTEVFNPGEYSADRIHEGPEGWYSPETGSYQPNNHFSAYQYNFCPRKPFMQTEGTIYWLQIRPIHWFNVPSAMIPDFLIGWKTTPSELHWNDDAVLKDANGNWHPLKYPEGHPLAGKTLDLSFVITDGGTNNQRPMDYGDAPDGILPVYPTLLGNNGARHVVHPKVYLGLDVDPDPDGQPDAAAMGDDLDGNDDEDGVTFTSPLQAGNFASVDVVASIKGYLNAWIDFNGDADWDDPGEQIFVDKALASGLNNLTYSVPDYAEAGHSVARFRFDTLGGLNYEGPAGYGEVEDYRIFIDGPNEPGEPPRLHLKWSQPPIEWDPLSKIPIFCGWDEPAYAHKAASADVTVWKLVADDFRCFGSMPVTSIHWWGSYLEWDKITPPGKKPSFWHVAFWNNMPPDNNYNYSRPSGPLWQFDVPADAVHERYVGLDRFPGKYTDTCFQYSVKLKPEQYFWQQRYLDRTQDNVFWISITAHYPGQQLPEYPWGWKTRPWHWMDDAIRITIQRDVITDNVLLVPGAIKPIKSSMICNTNDSYDMAFQLDTDPNFIKWEQPFTGIRAWPHYEDEKSVARMLTATNVNVNLREIVTRQVADDFRCTDAYPITAAVWWGSYIGYDYAACACQESAGRPQKPSYFLLSIWTDIPDPEPGDNSTFSQPGQKIWEYRTNEFDEVLVGYDKHPEEPAASRRREPVFRYSVRLPKDTWFYQKTADSVYWFGVVAVYAGNVASLPHPWGWTNHPHTYNDNAVAGRYPAGTAIGDTIKWEPQFDQTGVSEDMSFMLFTDPNERR